MKGWMGCSHHYPSIQICSFLKSAENLGKSGFPKKQGICGEIFPLHFYFLHLCQISGTKYGGLETVVFFSIYHNFGKRFQNNSKISRIYTLKKQNFPNFFCQNNNKICQPKNIGFELSKTQSNHF